MRLGLPEPGSYLRTLIDGSLRHRLRAVSVAVAFGMIIPTAASFITDGLKGVLATVLTTVGTLVVILAVLAVWAMRDLYYRQKSTIQALRSQVEANEAERQYLHEQTVQNMRQWQRDQTALQQHSDGRARFHAQMKIVELEGKVKELSERLQDMLASRDT